MSVLGKGTEIPCGSSAKTMSPCLVDCKEDYELLREKQCIIRDDLNEMTLFCHAVNYSSNRLGEGGRTGTFKE